MKYDENLPRIPENLSALQAVSSMMNHWSDELYRRRNTDESLAGECNFAEFPATLEEWQSERKRIHKLFEDHIYGKLPPPPDKLEMRILSEKHGALNGLAFRREIRIYCRMNDGRSHDFDMLLYVPENAETAVPVFVGLNFDGNQANTPDEDVRLTRGATLVPGHWWRTVPTQESKRHIKPESWNFEETIRRGYAVATADYGEIFPDNPAGFSQSIYTLFKGKDELTAFPPLGFTRDFGAISAWAWGLSRMLDILESIDGVDADNAAVLGHSRLGKTALWAGANDERFKLVISNNSGCLGAAPSKRNFGERVGHLVYLQRFWFNDKIVEYSFKDENLPVDQHQLLALVAPRALYVASSSEDYGADPYGEFLSTRAAAKVWNLYGFADDFPAEQPDLDVSVGSQVCYHIKPGKHSITEVDWKHYYDCADRVLKNNK